MITHGKNIKVFAANANPELAKKHCKHYRCAGRKFLRAPLQ